MLFINVERTNQDSHPNHTTSSHTDPPTHNLMKLIHPLRTFASKGKSSFFKPKYSTLQTNQNFHAILPTSFSRCTTSVKCYPRYPYPPQDWKHQYPYCGEDAYFFAINPKTRAQSFGVADGVASWELFKVDASEFAWQLMENCKEAVHHGLSDPVDILNFAYEMIIEKKQVYAGSATALVITIETRIVNDKIVTVLNSANLGDCCYVVLRKGKIIYKCPQLQHYFNAPYQLGVAPTEFFTNANFSDKPTDAVTHSMIVQDKDIIVVGSDGMFDNLFDEDIERIVQAGGGVNRISKNLLQEAKSVAKSGKISPFVKKAQDDGDNHIDAKWDDATVIVGEINSIVQ